MFGAEEVLLERATSANVATERDRHGQPLPRLLPQATTSPSTRTRRPATRRAASRRWRRSRWAACRRAATRRWRRCSAYGEAAPVRPGRHRRSSTRPATTACRRRRWWRRARTSCCSRRGAGRPGLPGADAQDQHQHATWRRASRAGSTSTPGPIARGTGDVRRAGSRSCTRWCSTSRAGARRPRASATASARSRSGRTASRCERAPAVGGCRSSAPRCSRRDKRSAGAGGTAAADAALPERVLQFGEGNFLRAFVDWMLHAHERGAARSADASCSCSRSPRGHGAPINAQDGLYTRLLRGLAGRTRRRAARDRVVGQPLRRSVRATSTRSSPARANPDLRFVVSNTTEAGIRPIRPTAWTRGRAPSFPGKLTQLLHARFRHFDGDADARPGDAAVRADRTERRRARARGRARRRARGTWATRSCAGSHEACLFTNTLVDRIVTGYPTDEVATLAGAARVRRRAARAGEHLPSWVIEIAGARWRTELPFAAAGLNVIVDARHDALPRAQGAHPQRRAHDDRPGGVPRGQGHGARVHGRSAASARTSSAASTRRSCRR